jgi:hypothetical protein
MKKKEVKPDLQHEGKDEVYLDIDRIINEGLSGGSVHMREGSTNIEEARDFGEEAPPNHSGHK